MEKRLLSIVMDMSNLHEHWFDRNYEADIELKTIHATGKLIIQTYLEAYPETDEAIKDKLTHTMNTSLDNFAQLAQQYAELAEIFSKGEALYKDKYWPRKPGHALVYFAKYAASPVWKLKAYTLSKK